MERPRWVTKKKYEERSGITVRAQESRIQRGVWERGKHYAVIDGMTMINEPEIDKRSDELARAGPRKGRGPSARLGSEHRLV